MLKIPRRIKIICYMAWAAIVFVLAYILLVAYIRWQLGTVTELKMIDPIKGVVHIDRGQS